MVTMKAILTSSLGGQVKMDGKRLPSKLPETNGLLKCIKDSWKNDSKVMIISGSPEYYDINDSVLFCLNGAFSLSNLSASEVLMCDERNKEIIERLPRIDVLILAGGHVPTQNSFMKTIEIQLDKCLKIREKDVAFEFLIISDIANSAPIKFIMIKPPKLPGVGIVQIHIFLLLGCVDT